jgi:hypothetical protein
MTDAIPVRSIRPGRLCLWRLLTRNWRLGLHLLMGTPRFGVNNRQAEAFQSWLVRPLFGFGWSLLWKPWRWLAAARIVRLRMEIAGLIVPRTPGSSP